MALKRKPKYEYKNITNNRCCFVGHFCLFCNSLGGWDLSNSYFYPKLGKP